MYEKEQKFKHYPYSKLYLFVDNQQELEAWLASGAMKANDIPKPSSSSSSSSSSSTVTALVVITTLLAGVVIILAVVLVRKMKGPYTYVGGPQSVQSSTPSYSTFNNTQSDNNSNV